MEPHAALEKIKDQDRALEEAPGDAEARTRGTKRGRESLESLRTKKNSPEACASELFF
jgi:hypothetical protein